VRLLIYVPVVHSEAELGSLTREIRSMFLEAFSVEDWSRLRAAIEAMWDGIRNKLLALPLRWQQTRLYQDGLPVCGREHQIVRDVAKQGSRNHQILLELMNRGATLMGTEDPELLVREYRRIKRLVQASRNQASAPVVEKLKQEGDGILRDRDEFIARRIDSTLGDDETGVLFLGLLHTVNEHLEDQLDVQHLIHNLPFGADHWKKLKELRSHGD
jgi:hypothetical protein